MVDKREKMIYYVSNLGTDMVSIIDGESYRLINEVEIGPRPQNIIVDEKNNVYIASDRNSKITLIDDLYDSNKTWCMPNNGNIQVDSITQKIYVCDTEEVCIYSLITSEKIGCITGFIAANSLKLDKDKMRLFVLDVLQNEIKVYDTSDFHLIKLYKTVGASPNYILLDENEKYLYIANKGINKRNYIGNISILDLESGNISYIDLQKGSVITVLEQNGILLYAANSGLHRIEVIDIVKRESISMIKTSLPELQRLRLSPDKKTLLVTSRSIDGKGAIDSIDISSNLILNTFTFEKNSIPFDIGVVIQSEFQVTEESFILTDSEDKFKQENGTSIFTKKVISTYEEKVIFPEVSNKVSSTVEGIINIKDIIFQKCEVINETKIRKIIDSKKEYSILQYDFYIPYYIGYTDEQEQEYVIEGLLKGTEKATLYIPTYAEQQGLQFIINSFAKLTSTPVIIKQNLKFDVSVFISTRVVVDEIVFIPLCKNCEGWQRIGKRRREGK